jgi:hypothetical protein
MLAISLREKNTKPLRCSNRKCNNPFTDLDIKAITNNNQDALNAFVDIQR